MKGCRAVELASGEAFQGQLRLMADSMTNILKQFSRSREADLVRDWQRARARLWSGLMLKLQYWRMLPWQLCALAHTDAAWLSSGS
jgi:hypothetical protein